MVLQRSPSGGPPLTRKSVSASGRVPSLTSSDLNPFGAGLWLKRADPSPSRRTGESRFASFPISKGVEPPSRGSEGVSCACSILPGRNMPIDDREESTDVPVLVAGFQSDSSAATGHPIEVDRQPASGHPGTRPSDGPGRLRDNDAARARQSADPS